MPCPGTAGSDCSRCDNNWNGTSSFKPPFPGVQVRGACCITCFVIHMLHHMLCYSHAAPHALSFTCFIIHMLHHPLCRSHAAPTAFVIRTLHCLLHILHHLFHILLHQLLLSLAHCTACFAYYTTCFIYCCTNCFCHSHTALPASHTTPPASHTAFVIPTLHCLLHILHHLFHILLHILLLSFPHCTACFTYYTTCFTYCFCHSYTAFPLSSYMVCAYFHIHRRLDISSRTRTPTATHPRCDRPSRTAHHHHPNHHNRYRIHNLASHPSPFRECTCARLFLCVFRSFLRLFHSFAHLLVQKFRHFFFVVFYLLFNVSLSRL
jgi:hypothetical protein